MEETYKMLREILIGKEETINEKILIKQYQDELCPNILAYFYCDNYGLIYNVSEFYPYISSEDKASFCLQELDKCLQKFNRKDIKFSTYFIKCYRNRLNTETKLVLAQKRKSILFTEELLDEKLCKVSNVEIENLDIILDSYKLDDKEKQQCKLINDGYTLRDISKILNKSESFIWKTNSIIKQKILNSGIDFA